MRSSFPCPGGSVVLRCTYDVARRWLVGELTDYQMLFPAQSTADTAYLAVVNDLRAMGEVIELLKEWKPKYVIGALKREDFPDPLDPWRKYEFVRMGESYRRLASVEYVEVLRVLWIREEKAA